MEKCEFCTKVLAKNNYKNKSLHIKFAHSEEYENWKKKNKSPSFLHIKDRQLLREKNTYRSRIIDADKQDPNKVYK